VIDQKAQPSRWAFLRLKLLPSQSIRYLASSDTPSVAAWYCSSGVTAKEGLSPYTKGLFFACCLLDR